MLIAAAWLRGAEYDEQYTLFLTAGMPRPVWPETVFPAGTVTAIQAGHARLTSIARDLRTTDVHPPLYFWAVLLWRAIFGPGLFVARMLSVLCGLASLCLVGTIARRCAIPAAMAMLLTLGCYGFTYTNAIARGFAPAQMLTLAGVALLMARRPMVAGLCLGAACCCNYLAVFVAAAAIVTEGAWLAIPPALPFLALDVWFFVAQHASRPGQFPPFAIWQSLPRLAEYQTAAVFGGLPLYVDGSFRMVAAAVVGMAAAGLALDISRARPFRAGPMIRLLPGAAVATPIGLLLLGATFDNTPIELRYLSFGLPFVGLLIAWAWQSYGGKDRVGRPQARLMAHSKALLTREGGLERFPFALAHGNRSRSLFDRMSHRSDGSTCADHALGIRVSLLRALAHPALRQKLRSSLKPRTPKALIPVLLVVTFQIASITGLLISPRTAQPARASAREAARFAADGVVLVPYGNDGVGIVGAFGIEAHPDLPILLVRPTQPIAKRVELLDRVILVPMAQDRDSTAALVQMRAVLIPPTWRRMETGFAVEVYERSNRGN